MTVMIDLTPGERARLRQLATQRGRQEKEQAQEMFRQTLDREWPEQEDTSRPDPQERERLIAAAQGGNLEARLRLLEIAPTIPSVDPVTGKPTPAMSREALRREPFTKIRPKLPDKPRDEQIMASGCCPARA